jgi:hypothetical protein
MAHSLNGLSQLAVTILEVCSSMFVCMYVGMYCVCKYVHITQSPKNSKKEKYLFFRHVILYHTPGLPDGYIFIPKISIWAFFGKSPFEYFWENLNLDIFRRVLEWKNLQYFWAIR